MPFGVAGRARALLLLVLCVVAGCSGAGLFREYEYQEDLYLALDGSVVVNVNASVAALVALRGIELDPDPRARIDQDRTRSLFEGPGARATVTLARRNRRRFVHVSVRAESLEALSRLAPFSWSAYRFDRVGDIFQFRQVVGSPVGVPRDDIRWTGGERVMFKLHLPSAIMFHNAPSKAIARGNILEWEQSLAERLAGRPLEMKVHLQQDSILYTTLLLFGGTIVAAAAALLLAVWWIARHGKDVARAAHDGR